MVICLSAPALPVGRGSICQLHVVPYDLDDGLMDKPDMTVKVRKQLKLLIYLCADCKPFLVSTDQLVDADLFTTVEYEFRTGINIRKKLGA